MAEKTELVQQVLHDLNPVLLGARIHLEREYSEVAEFLGYLISGRWKAVPRVETPLYRSLPHIDLSYCGDMIELVYGDERRFAALVDTPNFAGPNDRGVLNALRGQGCDFIETHSFSILRPREAVYALEHERDHLLEGQSFVEADVANIEAALRELVDGKFCIGEHHYSLVVLGSNVADAARHAAMATRGPIESSNRQIAPVLAWAAWLSQMPGNFNWRARKAKLSSEAYATRFRDDVTPASPNYFLLSRREPHEHLTKIYGLEPEGQFDRTH